MLDRSRYEDRLDRIDRRVALLYLLAVGRLLWGAVGLIALAYLILTR